MNTPSSSLLKKQRAARAALGYVHDGMILGVGTGSTVEVFIDLLVQDGLAGRLRGAISSSERSAARLRAAGVPILDLNDIDHLTLYIDGADEATRARQLIKGGGGALTREKIVAACAERFVCIVDDSKLVERLGRFPLPLEVIPMARGYVMRQLAHLGGQPAWRQGVITDNGNHIVDVRDLPIPDPAATEARLNQIVGVVTVGLFVARPADVLLIGTDRGVDAVV